MRQLNVHYERGLRGPVVPGHRRRVDHRPQATPEGLGGETITADQACQERSLQAVEDQTPST